MKLCIVSDTNSDLSELLVSSCQEAHLMTQAEVLQTDLDNYDAFALLCGVKGGGQTLLPSVRNKVEMQIRKGKPFFSEFCQVIGNLRAYDVTNTRFERPVVMNESPITGNLEKGIILDEQSNERIHYFNTDAVPLLQYIRNPVGFYHLSNTDNVETDVKNYALFFAQPNLLVCSFRLCNFAKAKFTPRKVWCELISGIVRWLGGRCMPEDVESYFKRVYRLRGKTKSQLEEVVHSAMVWFENADMLIMQGGLPYAVKEGLGSHVYPDGSHMLISAPRPDCAGEVSLAYYLYWLLTDERRMLAYSDGLFRIVRDSQVTIPGPHYGMMRWTQSSWWVCYQDDAARGLMLPALMRALIGGDRRDLPAVKACLDYLLSTTGSDGLRFCRTDYLYEDQDAYTVMGLHWNDEKKKWEWGGNARGRVFTKEELRSIPSGCPSAHYNAFYMASLLLYYLLTGERKYYNAGLKGLSTIMKFYPNTAREHSETQEYCRLILPLAILWKVTDDREKKEWLYRVAADLNRFRHPKGGFLEWDTGYIACCAGGRDGEASV
ncbi:MAG: hypothetical protein GX094_11620, partial [Clostridiales bacterium]|nr:hypothetical protein [Clostridiales bacterium]